MSISLLTACHPQASNKQLKEAKLNLFPSQMGSPCLGCSTKGHSLCDYVCNASPGWRVSEPCCLLPLRVSLAEIVPGSFLPGFSMSTLLLSPPLVTLSRELWKVAATCL